MAGQSDQISGGPGYGGGVDSAGSGSQNTSQSSSDQFDMMKKFMLMQQAQQAGGGMGMHAGGIGMPQMQGGGTPGGVVSGLQGGLGMGMNIAKMLGQKSANQQPNLYGAPGGESMFTPGLAGAATGGMQPGQMSYADTMGQQLGYSPWSMFGG